MFKLLGISKALKAIWRAPDFEIDVHSNQEMNAEGQKKAKWRHLWLENLPAIFDRLGLMASAIFSTSVL